MSNMLLQLPDLPHTLLPAFPPSPPLHFAPFRYYFTVAVAVFSAVVEPFQLGFLDDGLA
jgi:hypothetical protein